VACELPAFEVAGGVDAYAGLGTSVNGNVSFNPGTGQFSLGGTIGVGYGFGSGLRGGAATSKAAGLVFDPNPIAPAPLVTGGVNINATAYSGMIGGTASVRALGSGQGTTTIGYTRGIGGGCIW